MDQGTVINLAQNTIMSILKVSAPLLLVSILVGLAVSVFQATTQIHEQTLTFVPKIIAIMGAVLIFGAWMLRVLMEFTRNLYLNINQFIG